MRPPHCRPSAPAENLPSARFAASIRHDDPAGCRVALLGLPDDLGVRLNHGRPGAAQGPAAFRAALARYGVADPPGWDWPRVFDAGDIIPASFDGPPTTDNPAAVEALNESHRRITQATQALLERGLFPVAIGGGHDLTFPFVRAVIEWSRSRERSDSATDGPRRALRPSAPSPFAGVYFDAHLDVRETIGSGMPFRRLIEDCGVSSLRVHGLNPLVNSREHADWFLRHGGTIVGPDAAASFPPSPSPTLPSLPSPGTPFFASFDLDVIDAAYAPGVSAVNPAGWTPRQAEAAILACARAPGLRCFDIMELNPAFDDPPGVDGYGRTARLAAHLFLVFLRGFAGRPAASR